MKSILKFFIVSITIFITIGCGGSDPGVLKTEQLKGGKLIANVPANLLKSELIKKG